MIAEVITVIVILTGGSALMRVTGLRGWPLPAVGFVAGTSLMIGVATLQVLLALPTTPLLTLAITLAAPAAWWLWRYRHGFDVAIKVRAAGLVGGAVLVAVWLLRVVHLSNFHWDSYRYLHGSALIARNSLDLQSVFQFETRLLAVPVLHAPANVGGEFYLRSLTPLLGVATVIILVWMCSEGLRVSLPRPEVTSVTIAATALLVTNNRFVFHSFYINGHMVVAVLLLVIAGGSWLRMRRSDVPWLSLLVLQVVAVPALVVTRPEGSLLAGLAVIPFVVAAQIAWRQRATLLAVTGASILLWHGLLLLEYVKREEDIPGWVLAMTALGAVTLATIPALAWPRIQALLGHMTWTAEVGLWVALGFLTFRQPRILYDSAVATAHNVVLDATSWGVSLVVLGLLAIGVLLLTDAPHRMHLRYPLTTFVPLAAILAYLREGAYRVSDADSLNRMLLHLVPLTILFLASAATSHRWGFRRAESLTEGEPARGSNPGGRDRLGAQPSGL